MGVSWQPSLLDSGDITFDADFAALRRRELAEGAWVDHAPGWLRGADEVFARLLEVVAWQSRVVHMYEHRLREPRLTAHWRLDEAGVPLPVIDEMAAVLSTRYGVAFTSVGCNLYRDGADSVAWHGDRVARELPEAIVAIISVGHARSFRLRPKGGGRSIAYLLGRGHLLVMGGSCQRTWDHAMPKQHRAGPRISITFRHAYER